MTGFGNKGDLLATVVNLGGLAISAAATLLVSVILANGAGASAVGQFNQLAAVYIVASQLAAVGIHLAVLHFLPLTDIHERRRAALAALLAMLPAATLTGACVWLGAPLFERLLDSPGLAGGVRWVALATGLFAVNKLLLNLLNVFGHLIWLSLAQAVRPLIWLLTAWLLLTSSGVSQTDLGTMFVFGELGVLVFALTRVAAAFWTPVDGRLQPWATRLVRFGVRAFPSNAMTELNTRVDVLILGVFADDQVVGIYSFAALIAEGAFQIGVLLRTIINNRLVSAVVERNGATLGQLWRSTSRASWLLTAAVGLAAMLATPFAIDLLKLDPSLHQGRWVLLVLLLGVTVGAGFAPFWNVLLLAGRPGMHSLLMLSLLACNILLNAVAVPVAGMTGAGIATALSFLVFPLLLQFACRRVLGLELRGSR